MPNIRTRTIVARSNLICIIFCKQRYRIREGRRRGIVGIINDARDNAVLSFSEEVQYLVVEKDLVSIVLITDCDSEAGRHKNFAIVLSSSSQLLMTGVLLKIVTPSPRRNGICSRVSPLSLKRLNLVWPLILGNFESQKANRKTSLPPGSTALARVTGFSTVSKYGIVN